MRGVVESMHVGKNKNDAILISLQIDFFKLKKTQKERIKKIFFKNCL